MFQIKKSWIIQRVCGGSDRWKVKETVASLSDKSLVQSTGLTMGNEFKRQSNLSTSLYNPKETILPILLKQYTAGENKDESEIVQDSP